MLVQHAGRNRRNPTTTGTSRDAGVTVISVWQLAFLPRAEAYCGAPPADAISGANQARDMSRAKPSARLVPQRHNERQKPCPQLAPPRCFHRQPRQKPTSHEAVIFLLGTPKNHISAKAVPLTMPFKPFPFRSLVAISFPGRHGGKAPEGEEVAGG